MNSLIGIILKGIGGFYYVQTKEGTFECKARGIFRKDGITPYVGDKVELSEIDSKEKKASIEKILPRKNSLVRPPIANIDQLIIVASVCKPNFNTLVIDKLIAVAYSNNIKPVIVISKSDLNDPEKFLNMYSKSGVDIINSSKYDEESHRRIRSILSGKVSAFTGNSGVGKSTLLNCLYKGLFLKTGEVSEKLKRGRHTTRHVELFPIENSGYVADTPGFSSIDISRFNVVNKDELKYCFKEFSPFMFKCKFNSCNHICEKGCEVIEAVNKGEICSSRYNSYVNIYNEIKDIKKWDVKQ